MKLEKVLQELNSFEKNSFLKILESLIDQTPSKTQKIESVKSASGNELKNEDHEIIAKVFLMLEDEYVQYLKEQFLATTSQIDLVTDILTRDGNSLMKREWFDKLYQDEIKGVKKKVKDLESGLSGKQSNVEESRLKAYDIYKACVDTAYTNDDQNNQDRKVTSDEQSILVVLARKLGLSHEEVKLINYSVIEPVRQEVDNIIDELKSKGVLFYSKRQHMVYVPDEHVRMLRKVQGKQVADKFIRRVLKLLREPQINLICRQHNIDWKQNLDVKIKEIIREGVSFTDVLANDAHRDGTTLNDRKKFLNELCVKGLGFDKPIKGTTLEEKIDNLIRYFEEVEREDKVGISIDGFERLLMDLKSFDRKINDYVKKEYELQEEDVLKSDLLLDYNIKPRDVLELLSQGQIKSFCKQFEVSTRGDEVLNILDSYKDSDNLYLENYENIGYRNLAELKANGLTIPEAKIGVKFEELTKTMFEALGFNVDEDLRKKLNTSKDKADIILNLGNGEVIIVECKSVKEKGYNKFSSVSRQLKSYREQALKKEYRVVKSILVAPEYSDDFVSATELETLLNLSLLSASELSRIFYFCKENGIGKVPYVLFMRDVIIDGKRIIKALQR